MSTSSGKIKRWHTVVAAAVLLYVGLGAALVVPWRTTTSLTSPNQKLRAVLRDPLLLLIDRNFTVYIEETGGASRTIFRSPDEGPIGSERFIWSKDSKALLLVGSRLYARKGVQLASGEHLYMLCDIPTGRIWCNAYPITVGPPFGPDELRGYDFEEDLTLKPMTGETR